MKNIYKVISKFTFLILVVFLFIANNNIKSTTHNVTVGNFMFTPSNLNVNLGDTVKWNWQDGDHTTTCDGVFPGTSLPNGAAPWNSTISSGTPTFSYVVTVAGTYNYVCMPHSPGMAGVITASGSSTVLLTENFDYPAGDSLGAHGWVSFSGGSTNVLSVTSPGLVYSGYLLSNIGNATTLTTSGQDAYKDLSSVDTAGNLYISFMVNISSAQSTAGYFTALLPPTSTTNYASRFYAISDGANYKFGLSKSTEGAGGIFYTTDSYTYGTTYLVVIKYQRNPGADDDEMFAYIFSSGIPSTEPSTPSIGPVTGTAPDNPIGRVALRQSTASQAPELMIDGIQASKIWSDFATSITNYENAVADNFALYQNYPNPFNPSTTIKFNTTERGFVNLTVFNSLGKEVQTLVNDTKSSGLYSVDFNGNNLTSGIYFYRLTFSGDNGNAFTETKKLLLIK